MRKIYLLLALTVCLAAIPAQAQETDPLMKQAQDLIDAEDYDAAVSLLQEIADQGNAEAQVYLGDCYFYGDGVTRNYAKAAEYYQLAADQGNTEAQTYLGDCYFYGDGVVQNYEKAVEYYQLAADQGDSDAQSYLADSYREGLGVEEDDEEAVRLYQIAADQGNAYAIIHLGLAYSAGEGVEQDYEKAVEYFALGAQQEEPKALFLLGTCYQDGNGVEEDLEKAAEFYRNALDVGYEPGREDMERLLEVLGEDVFSYEDLEYIMFQKWLYTLEGMEEPSAESFSYHFASKDEGTELLLSNEDYFDRFCKNDLEFRMQKKDATLEEYLDYVGDQVEEFTDEEKSLINWFFLCMDDMLRENGYHIPALDEIILIKTTMHEEGDAGAYTHGTQIYLSGPRLEDAVSGDEEIIRTLEVVFWHELFHCLTRCNPDFREDMYRLIQFTVQEKDFEIPPSVSEYHITNPDVEHQNAYATFHIEGEDIDCFLDAVTSKHFEQKGEQFFDYIEAALVPVDGENIWYGAEQADNFNEILGTNTGYVIDPEECMADNFAYAMYYGMEGPEGDGYPNPEIIEGIIEYLKKSH